MYVCVPACVYVPTMCRCLGRPKEDPLELELHVVVDYLMWVLGTEPQS